jgi:hypothetical protein
MFTGVVEAFDEAALYEYEPDWNITLSAVEAVLEGAPTGLVQCNLTGINANALPKVVTSACIGVRCELPENHVAEDVPLSVYGIGWNGRCNVRSPKC